MKSEQTIKSVSKNSPTMQSNVAVSGYLPAKTSIPISVPAVTTPGDSSLPNFQCEKPRLLWVGDAMVPTGFATVTHAVVDQLCEDWNVLVSAVNCNEASNDLPYAVIPALQKEDMWGIDNFAELCAEFKPDVIVINNDWWNVARFLERGVEQPIVAYLPVDGANMDPADVESLNNLAAAVWYTDFGWQEAKAAGYTGTRHIVPHGVDLPKARRVKPLTARKRLGLDVPADAFLVGNVNRNQPRKRLDLTVDYFAEWIRENEIDDAWLCLHCARADEGWDLERLARYHGIADRVVFTEGEGLIGSVPKDQLNLIYQALDLQVSTTSGEGWGLTTMEGMSYGVPQIVPDWSALGEWPLGVEQIPCSTRLAHPVVNTIGAIPDRAPFIAAMDQMYRQPKRRLSAGKAAQDWVGQPQFRWDTIASQFNTVLNDVAETAQVHC